MTDLRKLREQTNRAMLEGRLVDAFAGLAEITQHEPDDLGSLRELAFLARDLKRAEAKGLFEKLAERYAADGLLLRAISAYREALTISPNESALTEKIGKLAELRERESTRPRAAATQTPRKASPGRQLIQALILPGPSSPPARKEPRVPLFSELPSDAFLELVTRMGKRSFAAGEVILKEGDAGTSCFVITSGRVRVEKTVGSDVKVLAHLRDGAFFGEMSLIIEGPRSATVVAEEPTEVFEIDRALLTEIETRHPVVAKVMRSFHRQRMLTTLLSTHPYFSVLSEVERERLRGEFKSKVFDAGELVFAEGSEGQGLFLVLSGEFEVWRRAGTGRETVASLRSGDVFGEASLLFDRPTSASVSAKGGSLALRLDREAFGRILDARPEIRVMLVKLTERRAELNRRK